MSPPRLLLQQPRPHTTPLPMHLPFLVINCCHFASLLVLLDKPQAQASTGTLSTTLPSSSAKGSEQEITDSGFACKKMPIILSKTKSCSI